MQALHSLNSTILTMNTKEIISWLLEGDVSIQFQTNRDLLNIERSDLQKLIESNGWGFKFLSLRKSNKHWGLAFYHPKWISTHYTLLDLKNLNISKSCIPIKESLDFILNTEKREDGGISPFGKKQICDVCVNGMALNYLCYFKMDEKRLESIVDFILSEKMMDGGFNCESNFKGARHSSLHTTISVLEGILEYKNNGYSYRLNELVQAEKESREFILLHRLFRSDKTGQIIDKKMLNFTFPTRWRYDIYRALDYFQRAQVDYDERMSDAIEILLKKRTKENIWKLQAYHPGKIHFKMEDAGKQSRYNTLRALRILNHFNIAY